MGGWNAQLVVGASSLADGRLEVVWVQGENCHWVLMRWREKHRWEGNNSGYYLGYNRV